jgi:hypothetical protein
LIIFHNSFEFGIFPYRVARIIATYDCFHDKERINANDLIGECCDVRSRNFSKKKNTTEKRLAGLEGLKKKFTRRGRFYWIHIQQAQHSSKSKKKLMQILNLIERLLSGQWRSWTIILLAEISLSSQICKQ